MGFTTSGILSFFFFVLFHCLICTFILVFAVGPFSYLLYIIFLIIEIITVRNYKINRDSFDFFFPHYFIIVYFILTTYIIIVTLNNGYNFLPITSLFTDF